MSANLYTLSSSSSSTDSLLELNSRERDKTNEHMGAYLPSNSLFNSNLYHATCLRISGNHDEYKHGYSQLQPFIFTVCFSFHPDYFDSQTRIKNMQMTQRNHKKFVTTASGSTRTAQPTNEQLIRLQSLAELRRKQLNPWNPHNRCIIPALSHELTHLSRYSKTFSIRTYKRLTRLRRRYNRYLMSRCIQYVTQTCRTYYTKVDYNNEGFQQCQENASYDSHDMTMQLDNYKIANKKRVAVGKRNPDITVLYVGSETTSKPSKPCACACTCAGNDPTDCERNKCPTRNKCPSRNKCCLTNKSGQPSDKYKGMNKKCVTNKKLPEEFDLDTNVLYDGSKSKGKSLQPFERSSGTSAPTDCVPYECYQKFKKIMPYGCNVSIQSGKNIISNVKQESIKKSTAKSVRETVYPCSRTKLNSSQPNKHSTGVNVSTNWDPNQCLQQVKKYTPYGCHASTQSSRYKMLKEKRDTVKPSLAKRGPDTAVPDVAARNQRNAKQPDDSVTMNCNPIDYSPQVKKYTAYGSHVFTQSSQYNMQEQRSSRREPCPEKHSEEKNTNYTKKKLKTFQCDPDTCVYRKVGVPKNPQQANKITITENQKSNQKNRKIQLDSEPSDSAPHKRNAGQRLQQTLKRICKPGDSAFGKCEPKDCYQRIQPTRFDIINACSSSRSSQGSTQTRKDKVPSPKSLKDTSYTKKGVHTTPRHVPGGRQAVNIGSTCSFNVVFYKDITQNGTVLQQSNEKPEPDKMSKKQSSKKKSSRKKLNQYECPPGMCVPRKQFDCKPGVCIPGKCNVSKCYQLLTANTRSHVTSRSSGEKKNKGRKVNGGNLIVNKDRSASGMTKHQMHTPNRHAGHNTLKCCCHVGFCEGIPQNVFVMNGTPSTQREVINPNEFNPSISDAGKCDPAACIQQALEQFDCEHGVCVPGKCFQQMKIADADGSHTSMSKTHVRNRRLIKEKNTLLYKDKHYFSMPRSIIPLHIPDTQVVRTGSNCSFNFEFYKSLAQNGVGVSEHIKEPAKDDRGDTPIRLTVRNTKKREECQRDICDPSTCVEQAVFNCEPGVCISSKCDPNKCLRRIKFTGTDTDADESRGSQASMLKIRQNKRRSLKENSIIYKYIGVFSIPRPKMAFNIFNTKVVNIGSKCGFNIDLYKGLPKNGFMKSDHINEHAYYDQDNTLIRHKPRSREKIHVLNPFECKPGVCAPGKCDPGKCFQRINVTDTDTDSNASYHGSQAYNNKGSFSVPKPNMILQIFNTHVVGIGSKCSCNVQFYKSLPQNGFGMSDQIYQPANPDQVNSVQDNKTSNRNTRQINPFECVPGICVSGKCDPSACLQKAAIDRKDCKRGVCVPGKCDPIKCFERLKFSGTDTGSVGSQASMSKTKGQLLKEENSILYKDKGLGTAPRSKMPLQIANRQAVRIGSKCSFNVEFYKSLPQNGFVTSENINEPANYYDQSNTPSKRKTSSSRKTRKEKNPFECEPGVCKPGKCDPATCAQHALKQLNCNPGLCVPGKCDPIKCFERLKVSGTDTESVGSQASKISKKRMTKRQLLKEENAILYKDKGFGTAPRSKMPLHIESRQTVRIGSKCSFNVEFYKSLPQNGFVTSESINEPANYYDQSNTPSKRKTSSSRKTRKEKNPFECEPGVCKPGKCDPATCAQHALKQLNCNPGLCVPGKCDPIKCFERLKVSGTDTESIGSQASKMSKKRMTKGQLLKEENSILYKDKGFGTAPRSKMPLHIENRQTVRIGSKCSFNIELYKSFPQNGFVTSEQSNQSTKYDQGDTSTRPKGSSRKKNRVLKPYECQPGVCIPRKCDPDKCLQQLKASGRDTNVITHGSQAYSRAGRKNKGSKRNQGNDFRSKDSSVSSSWGPMMPTHKLRHTVRVESGLNFNAELFKSLPPNGVVKSAHSNLPEKYDQGDTPKQQKASSRKKKRVLKPYECQPGVCIPRKCDPDKCLQQLKASGTDTNVITHGSQAYSRAGRKNKGSKRNQGSDFRSKDSSVSSTRSPKMPTHKPKHTVRVESGLKFNAELYKSLPPNGVVKSAHSNLPEKYDQGDAPNRQKPSSRKKKRALKPYQCQPGVCIPRKCDPDKCLQQLKASDTDTNTYNATSRGSLASSKSDRRKKRRDLHQGNGIISKDASVASMSRPTMPSHKQKHTVRIGSTLSFNAEFYKSLPPKGVATSENMASSLKNPYACKPGICVPGKCDPGKCSKHDITEFECQPGVCIPGKCDVVKCFQRLKISGTDTTVSNATSRGSQAYAKTLCLCRKKKGLTQDEGNGFRYKDQGAYSMRVPKMRVPQKQSFRIGSKCSFNIEFYKALPQNNFVRNISALSDQGDTPSRRKEGQVLNPFECKPGICVPGKCDPGVCAKHGLTGFECQPGLCIPGKCDVAKCFQNLNRNLKQDKQFECEPGVCTPGKCDPNSCLHRALNGFECLPGVCIPGKCDVAKCFQQLKSNSIGTSKKKKSKLTKLFECQRGVCVPGKCDPYECLARLKILHGASAYSDDGQAFTQTMKGGKVNRKRVAGKETLYKEKGASTMPRDKMPLHMPNRDVVRIGSNCSFNIEFYKEKPNNLKALSQIECEPGVCIPKKCDPIDCYQRLQNVSKREVVGPKRKGKGTKREVEEIRSGDDGPKPGAKKSKGKAKKIKETSPTQSVVDNSDQKISSPDQPSATQSKASTKSSKAKPPNKGIISLMKKCCKCKRKRKPKPDAIDDSQESITSEQTTDIKDESPKPLKPKAAKPKKQSKKKIIKKEAKRDPNEQSFERLDSKEDVVDTPPSVESPAKSAGTQSRKYPAREMMPRIKPPVKRNICECGAKILPPLADRIYGCIGRMLKARERKLKEEDYDIFVLEPNDCCCMGDVNNYCSDDVEEHGVVIGSCGGFNLKLTKNDTKTKNGSG